jgi:hypothetical protein
MSSPLIKCSERGLQEGGGWSISIFFFEFFGFEPKEIGEAIERLKEEIGEGGVKKMKLPQVLQGSFGVSGPGSGEMPGRIEFFLGMGPFFEVNPRGFNLIDPGFDFLKESWIGFVDFGFQITIKVLGVERDDSHEGDEESLDFENKGSFLRAGGGEFGEEGAEAGVEFIEPAVGFDSRVGFGDATVKEKSRGSIVSGFCGNGAHRRHSK